MILLLHYLTLAVNAVCLSVVLEAYNIITVLAVNHAHSTGK